MIVNIISKDQTSSVIEWSDEDGLHRGFIPNGLINGNVVDDKHLTMAIPYGIDWTFLLEDVIRPVTADDLAKCLRDHGIWTAEDARGNPGAVQGAILSAYGVSFQVILKVAKENMNIGGHNGK